MENIIGHLKKYWIFAVICPEDLLQTKNVTTTELHLGGPMAESKGTNDRAFEYYYRLREIKRFVEEHYGEDISLKRAARIAGLEKKYFSTFFHRKVGVSFKHWLTYIRIARAMELIKTEDYTISEIAHTTGFTDLRTFERSFKKVTKLTPRDFKNSVRPS